MHDVIAGWACIAAAITLPALVIARAILRDTTGTNTREASRLDHLDGVCGCEDGDCMWCAARRWER